MPNCFKKWCISETNDILLAWGPIVCLPPSVGIFLRVQLVLTLSPTFWSHLWKARRSRFWKDKDSFSGKLTKLCFYRESFYSWEQGKSLQKSRLHRWSLSTYKVDNSKFTKLMRHIDYFHRIKRQSALLKASLLFLALFSCGPKVIYAGNVSQGKTLRHAWQLWPFTRSLWGPSPQGSHVVSLNNGHLSYFCVWCELG